jgi:4-amino-4-deoxy-L-arabinose transferase-like glycosyltransferase
VSALPRRQDGRTPVALIAGLLAAAFLATRLALLWRFPWFVDETTFASFAKQVHGDAGQLFIAEGDKKGLLASWLGAALITLGIDPVTAMRLLAGAGAALAAACGGLIVRRLYGLREGLLTAALVALGPFFLVTASVGVYDSLVTGLVTAAVLVALRLAERPRLTTALLLGAVVGAGLLTKPTAWVTAAVLPATLLLIDRTSAERRRRLLRWSAHAAGALVLAYAIASLARLTPLYDKPIPIRNQRSLGDILGHPGLPLLKDILTNVAWMLTELLGYLTFPGLALALAGAVVAWRRRRRPAAVLAIWAGSVMLSMALLPLTANARYLATAIVPLAAFVAIGAFAAWDAVLARFPQRPRLARAVAGAGAAAALLPALVFNASVLADPATASYPGLDEHQYVTQQSALTRIGPVVSAIRRAGGPYPVRIDVGPYPQRDDVGPWGLDLRLNGTTVGDARRFRVFVHGTPAQRAAARWLLSDGLKSDRAPRPGYRLVLRLPRSDHGAVMRLYERSGGLRPRSGSR